MKNTKMNTKNFIISLVAVAFLFTFMATVSAGEITTDYSVTVEGIEVSNNAGVLATPVSVVAGEEFTLKVYFTSDVNDTDVTVEANVEGEKVDFDATSNVFDVEAGMEYRKVLTLTIPYELKDEISDDLTLSIEIDGKDHKTVMDDITLRVQRPSYNAVVKSVTTPSTIEAGETIPVEIVLKNMGYNDLDDVYVTVGIKDLRVAQGPKWFGDIVNLEDCDNDCDKEDTVLGKLYLKIPYEAESGVYTLEVIVQNDDAKTVVTKELYIKNSLPESVLVTSTVKSVAVGEDAVYEILIVNPTNNVKVYRIVADQDLFTASESVVAVPAGSSKTIRLTGISEDAGKFMSDVHIFEGEDLVKSVTLEMNVDGNESSTNAVVILTIVLAVIFIVLLVWLIVLLGRKSEKTEDFGESYY